MNDNVLVLGAGFSFDAGIPLLSKFVDSMWEYSVRGKNGIDLLVPKDKEILQKALEIRRELDGYHGRVAFDDRNLEDLLSMLAFNVLGGGRSDSNKLMTFTNALSTTIELSCNVKHPGYPVNQQFKAISEGNEIYRRFWKGLFEWCRKGNTIPTIITCNYDLVLERSLFQVLINTLYNGFDKKVPFYAVTFDYHYKYFPPEHYLIKYTTYGFDEEKKGTKLEKIQTLENISNNINIDILKLHGSLNFPKNKKHQESNSLSLTNILDDPYILPPVSNKRSNSDSEEIWKIALQRLREAKNVVFVGYSLPKTDMYMQYFLKAALGPNQELNKVFIFDPLLWTEDNAAIEMRKRFENCFSEQLRPRITFKPYITDNLVQKYVKGSTAHFVHLLEKKPDSIFF